MIESWSLRIIWSLFYIEEINNTRKNLIGMTIVVLGYEQSYSVFINRIEFIWV